MILVALVLYRNRLLLLKSLHNASHDAWELPSVEITDEHNEIDIQREFNSQIGIDLYPSLMLDSYNNKYPNNKITIYKCSLLDDPAALSLSSAYSGYRWANVLDTSQFSFNPPHDEIIEFILQDPYVIARRTAGSARRGFGSMDQEKRSMIAGLGGKAAHAMGRAHRFTREEASLAAMKGRGRPRKRAVDMTPTAIRMQLLTLLQNHLTQYPDQPISLSTLGKQLGIARQYARTLYHQLKTTHPVPQL
jgi:hypothetical protein